MWINHGKITFIWYQVFAIYLRIFNSVLIFNSVRDKLLLQIRFVFITRVILFSCYNRNANTCRITHLNSQRKHLIVYKNTALLIIEKCHANANVYAKNYTRFVTFKNLFEKYVDDCLQIDHMWVEINQDMTFIWYNSNAYIHFFCAVQIEE